MTKTTVNIEALAGRIKIASMEPAIIAVTLLHFLKGTDEKTQEQILNGLWMVLRGQMEAWSNGYMPPQHMTIQGSTAMVVMDGYFGMDQDFGKAEEHLRGKLFEQKKITAEEIEKICPMSRCLEMLKECFKEEFIAQIRGLKDVPSGSTH